MSLSPENPDESLVYHLLRAVGRIHASPDMSAAPLHVAPTNGKPPPQHHRRPHPTTRRHLSPSSSSIARAREPIRPRPSGPVVAARTARLLEPPRRLSASSAAVRLRLRRPRRRPPEGCAALVPPAGDQCRAPASLAPPRASPSPRPRRAPATWPRRRSSPPRAGSCEIRPEDRHRAQIRTGPTSPASSPMTPSPGDVFFQLR
nr:proline-rich protein 2-like [Aegilops tauschii subsp. strangulata]